jgi:Flp pilus assembly protein TadD
MILVLLCGTMLAGCSVFSHPDVATLTGGDTQAGHARKEAAALDKTAPTDLEGGIRQAQLMRLAGHYDDAIHVLSQLMLIASDDPRVVAEYGKTLAEKGRAQDAVQFLTRGIELASNDWTLYSALGVSYDQLGNQVSAKAAYEHALALRPEEPSVLNNYALSRMLAGDAAGARLLISRAERAGGASDTKIASNIAMLNKIDAAPRNVALADKPATQAAPQATPVASTPVASTPAANTPAAAVPQSQAQPQHMGASAAQNAPRSILPSPQPQQQKVAVAPLMPANSGVVMQAVPVDPLAGPVKSAAHMAHVAKATPDALVPPKIVIASEPAAAKAAPVKTASAKPADAKAVPAALMPPKIEIKSDPLAAKPAPVKTASAKPVDAKAIPAKATANDQIPALRMSANAY